MEAITNLLKSLLESGIAIVLMVVLLLLNSWIFKRLKSVPSEGNIVKNMIAILISLVGTLVFILTLPIENALKGQVVTFLGILISAGIALSSTTILGNLFAGIMNHSMRRFRNGDLVKLGDLQGRVVRTGSFHTEIQLEDSNFMTIPNLYIASNPVKLIRKSNTVISTTVSLGYDVDRHTIVEALKEAALETGLTDPYVYLTNLGDFSVSYKIHGFLGDSSKFFSTNSHLNAYVMDKLHERKIEIVSPTFMNQRRADDVVFIPSKKPVTNAEELTKHPEDLVFDEAIKSEKIEKKKDLLKRIDERIKDLEEQLRETEDPAEESKIRDTISKSEKLRDQINENIKEQLDQDGNSSG